jgi:hypothetical protein
MLAGVRSILGSWRSTNGRHAAVCPHIEAKGDASLCPSCIACPEVVIEGDQVRIGEDANTAVLKKDEWNVLVDLIQSGQLGRV